VGEVAGLGDRALHTLLALGQQRVEVVHQRLHFRRISSGDLRLLPRWTAARRVCSCPIAVMLRRICQAPPTIAAAPTINTTTKGESKNSWKTNLCGTGLLASRWMPSMLMKTSSPSVHSTEPTTSCERKDERAFMMADPRRAGRPHAIADPPHRFDGRGSELAAQPRHEHFHGVGVSLEALGVDVLGELAARDDAPLLVHQVRQRPVLVAGQRHRRAVECHDREARVQRHTAAAQLPAPHDRARGG
jgi:hypothetical protein